jgi:G3E family GTPase
MAVPDHIRQTVQHLTAKDIGFVIGPVIVLFDTTRSEKLLGYETLNRLITTQLRDADIIALSKVDAITEEAAGRAGDAVHEINPKADIVRLSVRTGRGIAGLANAVWQTEVRT